MQITMLGISVFVMAIKEDELWLGKVKHIFDIKNHAKTKNFADLQHF